MRSKGDDQFVEEKNESIAKPTFNSKGLLIPRELLDSLGIDDFENTELTFKVENGSLVVRKKESTSRLMKKFGYLKNQKRPNNTEMDWGPSVGMEKF